MKNNGGEFKVVILSARFKSLKKTFHHCDYTGVGKYRRIMSGRAMKLIIV